ncbi:hypothetical protein GC173_10330 [bacterium]|nr:hypothetical protein [bacterium]
MTEFAVREAVVVLVLKGTLVLSALWALLILLRARHPGWRMTLCRAGAVALILLPIVSLAAPRWRPAPLEPVLSSVGIAIKSATFGPRNNLETTVGATPATHRGGPARPMTMSWMMAIAWFGGVLLLTARHAFSHRSHSRLLATSKPAPAAVIRRADELARLIGRPLDFSIRIVPGASSPSLSGMLRPLIALPESLLGDPRELDAALAHELSHRAGSDHRWAAIIELARLVWWPHPLSWWLGAAHRSACEENSDAAAVRIDGDATWYSALLARMALHSATTPPTMAISMLNGSEIMARLRRIAGGVERHPLSTAGRTTAGSLVLGLAIACGSVSVSPSVQPAPAARNSSRVEAPPELVELLTRRGDDKAKAQGMQELEERLASVDSQKRAEALAAILTTADREIDRTSLLPLIRDALADSSPRARMLAVRALPVAGGDETDYPRLARLAGDEAVEVLEAIGNSIFFLPPRKESEARDEIVLQLLNHPDHRVVREALRGSWGNAFGEPVERRMIELSHDPQSRREAIYFGLSTRPVKSVAVVERLIAEMNDPTAGDSSMRAQWGLTHYPAAPEAKDRVTAELIARFDELRDTSARQEIIFYLGMTACGAGHDKLATIAADPEENKTLRNDAQTYLDKGC